MALQGCRSFWSLTLLGLLLTTCVAAKPHPTDKPQPLYSGYLGIDRKPGSSLYYAYWEASNGTDPQSDPILLWLQGGPGCASSFGAFYELGPYVTDANGNLVPNPFAWNRNFGLLIIDQPLGTGYSIAATAQDIPEDMTGMAQDLYEGIWKFFDAHTDLQQRPFIITGESYAGKYIPSIAHYILQVERGDVQRSQQNSKHCRPSLSAQHRSAAVQHSSSSSSALVSAAWQWLQRLMPRSATIHHQQGWLQHALRGVAALQREQHQPQQQPGHTQECWSPKHAWPLDLSAVPQPNFVLMGVAIGNGLTDPKPQTRALASVVFDMGLVSDATQAEISARTEEVVQLMGQSSWEAATRKRSALLDFIAQEAGVATLLDVRRTEGYDAAKAVDKLLDAAETRAWMRASTEAPTYASCSSVVEDVMLADVMRSCLVIMEDVLDTLPVLLYQGQFDVQDGVASTNAWIRGMHWDFLDDFEDLEGQLWYANSSAAAGWARSVSTLTQVVIRNAGHMAPRDQPQAALVMIEQWVGSVLDSQDPPQQQGRVRGAAVEGRQRHWRQQQHKAGTPHWRGGLLQAV